MVKDTVYGDSVIEKPDPHTQVLSPGPILSILSSLKGQRKSRKYEAIVHQPQVKLSPKPLSNPDTDLNPNWEAHEYH